MRLWMLVGLLIAAAPGCKKDEPPQPAAAPAAPLAAWQAIDPTFTGCEGG